MNFLFLQLQTRVYVFRPFPTYLSCKAFKCEVVWNSINETHMYRELTLQLFKMYFQKHKTPSVLKTSNSDTWLNTSKRSMQLEHKLRFFGLFLSLLCSHEAGEAAEGLAEHAGEWYSSNPSDILYCVLCTADGRVPHGSPDSHAVRACCWEGRTNVAVKL